MALECNQSGTIPVIEIINAINSNEAVSSSNKSRLDTNDSDIAGINNNISTIDNRLSVVEFSNPPSIGDFNELEGRISTNENNIAINQNDISQFNVQLQTNLTSISNLQLRVSDNESDINVNSVNLSAVSNDILRNINPQLIDHDSRILALESTSTDSVALLCVHEEEEGVGAGSALALTWTARNIGIVRFDTIGGVSAATSYTLPPGKYKIHAKCSGNSDYHQSRLIAGIYIYYGNVVSNNDMSEIDEILEITSSTNISIETKINSVGTGNELGSPSPWGTLGGTSDEKNRYVTLSIDKIG